MSRCRASINQHGILSHAPVIFMTMTERRRARADFRSLSSSRGRCPLPHASNKHRHGRDAIEQCLEIHDKTEAIKLTWWRRLIPCEAAFVDSKARGAHRRCGLCFLRKSCGMSGGQPSSCAAGFDEMINEARAGGLS